MSREDDDRKFSTPSKAYEEAERRIKAVYDAAAPQLDLGLSHLLSLPPSIRTLNWIIALDLTGTSIADISALSECVALEQLDLGGSRRVKDISALQSCARITRLGLRDTSIDTLDVIANMPRLQLLYASATTVQDLTPLSACGDLTNLQLDQTHVTDLGPLKSCDSLETIGLTGSRVADLSPLAGCRRLQSLQLGLSRITDLKPLANCSALRSLGLAGTRVEDLAPLVGCTELRTLILGGTRVTDLAPLAEMRAMCAATQSDASSSHLSGLSFEAAKFASSPPFDKLAKLGNPARTIETINYVRRSLGKEPFVIEGYTPPQGFEAPEPQLFGHMPTAPEVRPPPVPAAKPAPLPDPARVPAQVKGGLTVGGDTDKPIALARSAPRARPPRIEVLHGELLEQTRALVAACGKNNAAAAMKARLVRLGALLGQSPDDMLADAELVWFRIDEVRALYATELAERAKADRLSQELPPPIFAAAEAFVRASNVVVARVPALAELDGIAPGPDQRRSRKDIEQAAAVAKVLADAPEVVSKDLADTLVEAVNHAGVDPDTVPTPASQMSPETASPQPPAATPDAAPQAEASSSSPRAEEFAGRSVVNTVLELVKRAAAAVRDAAERGTATVAGWGRKAAGVAADYMVGRVKAATRLAGSLTLLGGFVGTVVKFQVVLSDLAMRWLPGPAYQAFKFTLDNIVNVLGGLFKVL